MWDASFFVTFRLQQSFSLYILQIDLDAPAVDILLCRFSQVLADREKALIKSKVLNKRFKLNVADIFCINNEAFSQFTLIVVNRMHRILIIIVDFIRVMSSTKFKQQSLDEMLMIFL